MYPTVPPKVEYELTATGRTLREPLAVLVGWAEEHRAGIARSRAAYDRQPA